MPVEDDRYRKLFGEVALELGFVTPSQLYEALTQQVKTKERTGVEKLLGQVLLELGYLDTDQIQRIIDRVYPRIPEEDELESDRAGS